MFLIHVKSLDFWILIVNVKLALDPEAHLQTYVVLRFLCF